MNTSLALPLTEAFLRLGVATVLGGIVGLERERLERAAGLRTHALVALASALIMLVSAYSFADLAPTPRDPTRMAAQVVSGIGFLGAGVIISARTRCAASRRRRVSGRQRGWDLPRAVDSYLSRGWAWG